MYAGALSVHVCIGQQNHFHAINAFTIFIDEENNTKEGKQTESTEYQWKFGTQLKITRNSACTNKHWLS